jgi:hypothetical protein
MLIILASFPVDITVVDINPNMLVIGKHRANDQNILESKDLVI